MKLEMYVYGHADVIAQYFNAIAAMMGSTHYGTAFRIATLMAGVTVLFQYIARRNIMDILKWILLYYMVLNILFIPKVTVVIIDKTQGEGAGTAKFVDKVPFGVAVVAHYGTALGAALTEMTETGFAELGDLQYRKSSMVMASRLVSASSTFQIPNAIFNENMQAFVQQCVFYDLFLNKYTLSTLEHEKNLWGFMIAKASPARMFAYTPLNGNAAKLVTCKDGAGFMEKEWGTVLTEAQKLYGARFFAAHKNPAEQFAKYLPLSYSYLLKASGDASALLKQSMMANAISNTAARFSTTTDASAALQSFISAKTHLQERLTYRTIGERAAHWLPLLKNALEAILYGTFVIVMLLMVFPFGGMVLRNYVFSLVWLQAWSPLYAIVNLMVSFYAKQSSTAQGGGGMTLHNLDGIFSINADMAALAGYLSLSVPMLAFGLVRGFGSAMSSMAQYVGGLTQSVSTQVAGEAAGGNISVGNTSFDNHSASNMSSNHVDTMGRVVSGGMSMQTASGSTLTMTPSGAAVLNMSGALSNLGVSVNMAESLRSSYMQQADSSYQAGLNESKNYQESVADSVRDLHDFAKTHGKSSSSGETATLSNSSSFNNSVNEMNKYAKDLSQKHGISEAEASDVIKTANVGGKLGLTGSAQHDYVGKRFSISASGSIEGGISKGSTDSRSINKDQIISDAINVTRDMQYQNQIETATRATKDSNFQASTDEGQRLTNNISASLDRAKQSSEAMNSHFQRSDAYRQQATRVQENSASINTNANQQLLERLANQPGTNGRGRIGEKGAEYLMLNDQQAVASVARQMIAEQTGQMSQWNRSMPGSEGAIRSAYERNNQSVNSGSSIDGGHKNSVQQVNNSAVSHGLGKGSVVDNSIKGAVDAHDKSAKQQMEGKKQKIDSASNPITKEISDKTKEPIENLHWWSSTRK